MSRFVWHTTLALVASALALAWPATAKATIHGALAVRTNTTLTDDVFGNVVFAASNVTLDCAGHKIHISSSSQTTCRDPQNPSAPPKKCAIDITQKDSVSVKNCTIVGNYDVGIWLASASNVSICATQALGNSTGLVASSSSNVSLSDVTADSNGSGVWSWSSSIAVTKLTVSNSTTTGIQLNRGSQLTGDGVQVFLNGAMGISADDDSFLGLHAPFVVRNASIGIWSGHSTVNLQSGHVAHNSTGLSIGGSSATPGIWSLVARC